MKIQGQSRNNINNNSISKTFFLEQSSFPHSKLKSYSKDVELLRSQANKMIKRKEICKNSLN